MRDQLDSEEYSESQVQVILAISTIAENDSLTTVNFIDHHTIKQSFVMYSSNCATNRFSENIAASNVSAIDLIVEENKKPARFHLKGLNLKLRAALHVLVVALVISFIVGLFTLPILFFYIRPSTDINMANSSSMSMDDLLEVCNTSITNNSCARDVMNTYATLRKVSESTFPFCIQETQDLFCDALSKCDDLALVGEIVCQEIRQKYCTSEWRILEVLNRTDRIFDCDDYGETIQLNCSDQFDLDNNDSVCSPLCKSFSQHGDVVTTILVVDVAFAHLINVIGGVIVLIAAIYNRKNMFKYPQVLLVINAILITVQSILISLPNITLGEWNPLCSDKYIFNAIDNPTTYCKIQAFIGIITIVMYSMFWFVYILHLYLTLIYPLKTSRVNKVLTSRVTHVIEVAAVIIIVTTPNIYFLATSQYQIINFPPLFCGAGVDVNFYGIILPTVVINCASLIMMLLVLQKIHGHYKRKSRMSKQKCFSIPEVKIFATLSFLLVVLALLWIGASFQVGSFETIIFHITNYIQCNLGGIRTGLDCEEDRRKSEALSYPYLTATYNAAYAILNLSNLPLVLQYDDVKQSVRRLTRRISTKMFDATSHLK
ncbi:uncharacterized protein [Dysidea avara]